MNAWVLAGFGTNAAVIFMALAWAIARHAKNASYLEVAWSYGFAVVVWIYALLGTRRAAPEVDRRGDGRCLEPAAWHVAFL